VIDDLEKSRPPVIIFNDTTFGLPDYDGITTMERDYNVSQYVLDHYQPLLDTDGQLVMIRDDLAASAPPPPKLSQPPVTTGLYFDMPSCNWGDIPNFFDVPSDVAQATSLELPLTSLGLRDVIQVSGWVFDESARRVPKAVLVVSGGRVIASAAPSTNRPDVAAALGTFSAQQSGFSVGLSVPPGTPFALYALNSDGSVSVIPDDHGTTGSALTAGSTLTTADGLRHIVREAKAATLVSSVDTQTVEQATMYSVQVPAGVSLSSYDWMDFGPANALGNAEVQLSDTEGMAPSHTIQLSSLNQSSRRLLVQVGSCLQWHGYQSKSLYLAVGSATARPSLSLLTSR
jgi:hypothetical protein